MTTMKQWVTVCALAMAGVVQAVPYYWSGGDGTWDTATNNWKYGASDGPATNWPADDATAEAVFAGTGSKVTVSGTVNAGKLTFNTGGWSVTNGAIVMKGDSLVTVNSQTSGVYSSIQGTAGLDIAGSGMLRLGTNNTYTGGTTITNATVWIETSVIRMRRLLGYDENVSLSLDNATLIFKNSSFMEYYWITTLGPRGATMVCAIPKANSTVYFKKANQILGSGTLTLRSSPGYNCGFSLENNCFSSFGGKYVLDGVDGGSRMQINGFNSGWGTATGDDTVTVTNYVDINLGGTNDYLGSASQGVTVVAGATGRFFNLSAPSQMINILTRISGAGAMGFVPKGSPQNIYLLSNTNNAWSDGTTIANQSSNEWGFVRLGDNEVLPHGSGKGKVYLHYINVGGRGRLDLNGKTETINGLSSTIANAEIMNLSSSPARLLIGAGNATDSYAGMINHSNGVINIVKIGTGTQTFSGTNTYQGATVVSNGVLKLTHALCLPSYAEVHIAAGATNELAFIGTNTIRKLFVDAAQQKAGVYGTNNLATVLAGSGRYQVTEGPVLKGTMISVW